jgi:hypothetical protein
MQTQLKLGVIMTAIQPLAVALVAAHLLACSSKCWQSSNAEPAVFVSGTGNMDVTCADGTRRPSKLMSRMLYFQAQEGQALFVDLDYRIEGVTPNLLLNIRIPSELADGSYPLNEENPRITVGPSGSFGAVESITGGTFSFQRTRDVPFADIEAPDQGEFTSSIEFTLEMEGTLADPGHQCAGPAPFTIAPVTVQLNNVAVVAECSSSLFGD